MYRILKDEENKGFGYVVDYMGNKWYYGRIKECRLIIKEMEVL